MALAIGEDHRAHVAIELVGALDAGLGLARIRTATGCDVVVGGRSVADGRGLSPGPRNRPLDKGEPNG